LTRTTHGTLMILADAGKKVDVTHLLDFLVAHVAPTVLLGRAHRIVRRRKLETSTIVEVAEHWCVIHAL
jgi:hypothetical protein